VPGLISLFRITPQVYDATLLVAWHCRNRVGTGLDSTYSQATKLGLINAHLTESPTCRVCS